MRKKDYHTPAGCLPGAGQAAGAAGELTGPQLATVTRAALGRSGSVGPPEVTFLELAGRPDA